MDDLFKINLHNSIINGLKNNDRIKKASTANTFANKIANIVINFKDNGEDSAIAMLEEEESQKIFQTLGLQTNDFLHFIKASINQKNSISYKLKLTEIAESLLDKLLLIQDNREFCWYFHHKKEDSFLSTAWDTATCVYALHKINNYLKNRKINDFIYNEKDKVINKKINLALEWLFRTPIFNQGWSDAKYISTKDKVCQSISSNLIDTAYVLNIIIRIKPVYRKNIESILIDLIKAYNRDIECWTYENYTNEIDIIKTCYCLRLLSAFIKYASDLRTNILWILDQKITNEIMIIRQNASSKVAMAIHENDWGCGYYWKSNLKNITDAQTTALCILALVSCGFTYKDDVIKHSCEWLLSEMKYYEGCWCWTKKNSDGSTIKSISETAIIVSALLKTANYSVIAKLEGVFLWLTNELNENYLNDENEVKNLAPLLCVFSEYLKFLDE